jgi:hypothetical protein
MTTPEQSEEPGAPEPDECPSPRPGTRMLELPPDSADPARLAAESIERLKREQNPRPLKQKKEDES